MRTFLRILKYGKPYNRTIPLYALTTILHTVFSVVNISVMIPILQILFEEQPIQVLTAPTFEVSLQYFQDLFYYHFGAIVERSGKMQALYFVTVLLVSSFLLSNIFGIMLALLTAKVRIRVITELRRHAFACISKYDMGYFTINRKGDMVARITSDIQQVEATVVGALKALIKEPVMIIAYFVVLFRLSPELTLYSVTIIPLSGGAISYLTKRLRKRARLTQDALSGITSSLDEIISGMRIVKAFNARAYVESQFAKEIGGYARHNYRMSVKLSFARPVSEFFGVIVMGLILIIGGSMVLSAESLTGATFVGFLIVFSQILNPAKSFSTSVSNIQRGLVAADRVFELVDHEPKINNLPDARPISTLEQDICFRDVSFAYEERRLVLKNISFQLRKGDILALVGPSGGGKSTIADLLPRFYDPVDGEVLFDGMNLKHLDLGSLRSLIGVVTQESILFHDTIFNNIAFGKPDASQAEVEAAAEVANALGFIRELPNGFHTYVGERGTKLSGGQRQRISIARAVLKNPPILILDEATSALDSQSERLVQEAIFKLMQNRTTLVIAHRLSTIQQADQILVIEDGMVREKGKHEELISKAGLYKKLIDMQSFD